MKKPRRDAWAGLGNQYRLTESLGLESFRYLSFRNQYNNIVSNVEFLHHYQFLYRQPFDTRTTNQLVLNERAHRTLAADRPQLRLPSRIQFLLAPETTKLSHIRFRMWTSYLHLASTGTKLAFQRKQRPDRTPTLTIIDDLGLLYADQGKRKKVERTHLSAPV